MVEEEKERGQVKERKNLLAPLGEFFLNTSSALWHGLLNEPDQKTQQNLISEEMIEKLQTAADEKNIVVLLVEKAYDPAHYETITGWISAKELTGPLIPVKLPAEAAPIQMVPLKRVKKISILAKNGVKISVTRG